MQESIVRRLWITHRSFCWGRFEYLHCLLETCNTFSVPNLRNEMRKDVSYLWSCSAEPRPVTLLLYILYFFKTGVTQNTRHWNLLPPPSAVHLLPHHCTSFHRITAYGRLVFSPGHLCSFHFFIINTDVNDTVEESSCYCQQCMIFSQLFEIYVCGGRGGLCLCLPVCPSVYLSRYVTLPCPSRNEPLSSFPGHFLLILPKGSPFRRRSVPFPLNLFSQ